MFVLVTAAGSQSFNAGGGPFGGGFSGSAANAAASSQSFNAGQPGFGFGPSFGGSASNAGKMNQNV